MLRLRDFVNQANFYFSVPIICKNTVLVWKKDPKYLCSFLQVSLSWKDDNIARILPRDTTIVCITTIGTPIQLKDIKILILFLKATHQKSTTVNRIANSPI